jgi:hypothetical protein
VRDYDERDRGTAEIVNVDKVSALRVDGDSNEPPPFAVRWRRASCCHWVRYHVLITLAKALHLAHLGIHSATNIRTPKPLVCKQLRAEAEQLLVLINEN